MRFIPDDNMLLYQLVVTMGKKPVPGENITMIGHDK